MKKFLVACLMATPFLAIAQSNNEPSDYNPHSIKITGYFQFQFQKAAAQGIPSFAGGDFVDKTDNRFIIRRGRLKVDRVDELTNIVFQLDATQDGVKLTDGFIQFKDKWTKTFMLTAGQFTKPFGQTLVLSSGVREFPERPRAHQLLFPNERDIGAMLTIHPQNKLNFLTWDIAVVNGSGLNFRDYDNRKDLSTVLNFDFSKLSKAFGLSFGASYYNGYVEQGTNTVYNNSIINNQPGFAPFVADENIGGYAKREYKGAHLTLNFKNDTWGDTNIRSEFIYGTQPGIAPSASVKPHVASRSFGTQPTTDMYNRHFNSFFIWLTKEIPKTQLQLIAAYDFYDPNTFVKGNEIGAPGSNTTAADIKYQTFGGGIVYYMTKQLKFVAYYDHPINESTRITNFTSDAKDDLFTLRAQYRF